MRRLAILLTLAAASCFSPDEPVCAYACGDNGACPDDYECRADNYCHKVGSTGMCPYPDASFLPDFAGADLAGDMTVPVDMAVPLDMSMADMSVPDMAQPVDMAKPIDMTQPVDMTQLDGLLQDASPTD